MSELFDNEDDLVEEDPFLTPEEVEEVVPVEVQECPTLDARRRLEKMLEEKRLREELNDFVDY